MARVYLLLFYNRGLVELINIVVCYSRQFRAFAFWVYVLIQLGYARSVEILLQFVLLALLITSDSNLYWIRSSYLKNKVFYDTYLAYSNKKVRHFSSIFYVKPQTYTLITVKNFLNYLEYEDEFLVFILCLFSSPRVTI